MNIPIKSMYKENTYYVHSVTIIIGDSWFICYIWFTQLKEVNDNQYPHNDSWEKYPPISNSIGDSDE